MIRIELKYIQYVLLTIIGLFWGLLLRSIIGEYKSPSKYKKEQVCHIDSLKRIVISNGDVCSYNELRDSFLSSKFPDESLFYSMIMAKQYGYQPANIHVCQHLRSFYTHLKKQPMDSFTDSIYQTFLNESKKKR